MSEPINQSIKLFRGVLLKLKQKINNVSVRWPETGTTGRIVPFVFGTSVFLFLVGSTCEIFRDSIMMIKRSNLFPDIELFMFDSFYLFFQFEGRRVRAKYSETLEHVFAVINDQSTFGYISSLLLLTVFDDKTTIFSPAPFENFVLV